MRELRQTSGNKYIQTRNNCHFQMEFANLFNANAVLPEPSFDITTWNAYIIVGGKRRIPGCRPTATHSLRSVEHAADSDPVSAAVASSSIAFGDRHPMTDTHVKTAVITGAGTGIGRAIAVAFCKAGMNCVLAGRRADVLEETAGSARNAAAETLCVPADVTCRDSVKALSDQTLEHFGRIDILVNNAGINTLQRGLRDISDEDWDRVVDINLTGAFNAFRAVMPHMEKQGDGLVINISSMAGKRSGKIAGVAYCASKFGMAALNQSINAEFRETGIRACCIFPGEVDTPILDLRPNPVSDEKRAAALPPEDIAAAALMVAQLPGRAIVEEITIFPRQIVEK